MSPLAAVNERHDSGIAPGEPDAAEGTDSAVTVPNMSVPDATVPMEPPTPETPMDHCGATIPSGWPGSFTVYAHNPVLTPNPASPSQGNDNIYAPDIHFDGSVYRMWYGGQGGDGHDQIFAAWSRDGMAWRVYPTGRTPFPVLPRGSSNHVNDPSVVRVGNTWRMYYTDAPIGEIDRIWLAESTNGVTFTKVAQVLDVGPPGSWDAEKVGRPSVQFDGQTYTMWYDATAAGRRHVGVATSSDGVHFTKYAQNPVVENVGAIDVKRVGNGYVLLNEAMDGTHWATSGDGFCWTSRGLLFGLSGRDYDRYGQVTPHIAMVNGQVRGIYFGGASVSTWNRNRIAVALPSGQSDAGGGCTACAGAGLTCAEACQGAHAGNAGSCAAPGSTSGGQCCACASEGCEACTGGIDCNTACVGAGKLGGYCGAPGSTDPGHCCACL
ncbi:MAG: hypothetical protein R3A78_04570 [Polyangiales bacterium]|nr:hypothetical protein [Myxococcales bacterium]